MFRWLPVLVLCFSSATICDISVCFAIASSLARRARASYVFTAVYKARVIRPVLVARRGEKPLEGRQTSYIKWVANVRGVADMGRLRHCQKCVSRSAGRITADMAFQEQPVRSGGGLPRLLPLIGYVHRIVTVMVQQHKVGRIAQPRDWRC
jgi:hypothetical protein